MSGWPQRTLSVIRARAVLLRDTDVMLTQTLLVLAAASLPLALLTALGAHQRGLPTPRVVLSSVFYPVAWIVWYVRDEHPYRRYHRTHRHTA